MLKTIGISIMFTTATARSQKLSRLQAAHSPPWPVLPRVLRKAALFTLIGLGEGDGEGAAAADGVGEGEDVPALLVVLHPVAGTAVQPGGQSGLPFPYCAGQRRPVLSLPDPQVPYVHVVALVLLVLGAGVGVGVGELVVEVGDGVGVGEEEEEELVPPVSP